MEWEDIVRVFEHYNIDIEEAKTNKEEFDFVIYLKEDARETTGNMAGFQMDTSQRVIIDFDKDYKYVLVRRIKKRGASGMLHEQD